MGHLCLPTLSLNSFDAKIFRELSKTEKTDIYPPTYSIFPLATLKLTKID